MGDATVDRGLPDEFGELVADLRSAFLEEPSADVANRHLAALVQAADEVASRRIRDRKRRRRVVATCAGVGVSAALLVPSGMAAASGDLPGPLQRMVAKVAAPFGIELPTEGDANTVEPVEAPTNESPEPAGSADTAEQPAPSAGRVEGDHPASPDPSASEATSSSSTIPGTVEPSEGIGQPGNRPDIPPGQETQPGNRPDIPPGQSGSNGNGNNGNSNNGNNGNKPESPPGQSNTGGQKPSSPPGQNP